MDDNTQAATGNQPQSTPEELKPEGGQQSPGAETLDDVYKRFNVDDVASQFRPQVPAQTQVQAQTQQPPVRQQPPAADVPDPVLDPNGYRAWAANQSEVLRSSLDAVKGQLSQMQLATLRQQEERDIGNAIQAIKEKGVELDNDTIEIALGVKARKDPRFLSIFNNRGRNPQAWTAALGAVANEIKGKFQFRADPQLAENVRAAKASTQQASLTSRNAPAGNPIEDRLSQAKSPQEFSREWERLIHGGTY